MRPAEYKKQDITERFWSKVLVGAPDECWPYQGYCDDNGYGQFKVRKGELVLAHRFAYESATGEVAGEAIMHLVCDNPPCCNPAHLGNGTRDLNNKDAAKKGRTERGDNRYNAVLNDDLVRQIRTSELSSRKAAAHFGVSDCTIRRIRNRQMWKHVE